VARTKLKKEALEKAWREQSHAIADDVACVLAADPPTQPPARGDDSTTADERSAHAP